LRICNFFFDTQSVLDFVLGFLAVLIPNALFAINLSLIFKRISSASTRLVLFFLGESVKVLFTITLMYLFSQFFSPVDWIVLLLGALMSLKAIYLLPILFKNKV